MHGGKFPGEGGRRKDFKGGKGYEIGVTTWVGRDGGGGRCSKGRTINTRVARLCNGQGRWMVAT